MMPLRTLGTLGVVLMLSGGLGASGWAPAPQSRDYLMVLSAVADYALVGENAFEVVVVDADDNPVEDAEVTAQLSMPSMTMPGAPFLVNLAPVGKGWYRGIGHLTMAGRWDVTIDAKRSGRQRGTTQIAVEASASTDDGRSTPPR